MGVEIIPLGGYEEVGKNSTAVKVDEDVFILDMGIDLSKLLMLPKGIDWNKLPKKELILQGVIPDDSVLTKYKHKVKAIIPSHAHLDHVGAIAHMANDYPSAKIIGTPYTTAVLKKIMKSEGTKVRNPIIDLKPNSKVQLTPDVELELINATHSTPHTAIIVLHTPYGSVIYANDWKFDATPALGERTNMARLKKIGNSGDVLALISCCLNVDLMGRTYSESVVTEMLKDVLLEVDNKDNGVIVSTFSSNIGRIRTITDIAKKMGRKTLIFGSSMQKYIGAAEEIGLVNLSKANPIKTRATEVKSQMQMVNQHKNAYLLIMTGHQGEPGSVLERISRKELPLKIGKGDQVVFSSRTIPAPVNIANKTEMVSKLKRNKARIFDNVHVSGHGSKEEQRDLINLLQPKNFIPCHGSVNMLADAILLAHEMGYKLGKESHILTNGQRFGL